MRCRPLRRAMPLFLPRRMPFPPARMIPVSFISWMFSIVATKVRDKRDKANGKRSRVNVKRDKVNGIGQMEKGIGQMGKGIRKMELGRWKFI